MDAHAATSAAYVDDGNLPVYVDQPVQQQSRHRVQRKPVSSQLRRGYVEAQLPEARGEKAVVNKVELPATVRDEFSVKELPQLLPRPELSVDTSIPLQSDAQSTASSDKVSMGGASTATTHILSKTDSFPTTISTSSTASSGSGLQQPSTASHVKKAFEEARHFTGGLRQRPFESTKHFTILRHSHGIVFFQGINNSLAISIFADDVLPYGHTLWLQSKGWTRKTGMKAKSLVGRRGSWLNVTPTAVATVEQLNPTDERAWQRDFRNFQKKAPPKIRDLHRLRETAIVRIPAEAGDGYFQIVLCTADKKKVLCASPTFRVLSTSASPSSIRGASLSSLPLELGALALSKYTSSTIGSTVNTVAAPLQNQVQQYMPSFCTREAASVAYGASGAEARVDNTTQLANSQYQIALQISQALAEGDELALEEGPTDPYPICFTARARETANEADQFSDPKYSLSVFEDVKLKLHGYYFGWTRPLAKKPLQSNTSSSQKQVPWTQTIISATLIDPSALARAKISHANQKTIELRPLQVLDLDLDHKLSAALEIRILGLLRPEDPLQRENLQSGLEAHEQSAIEEAILADEKDAAMAHDILDHPSWTPNVPSNHRMTGDDVTSGNNNAQHPQHQQSRGPVQKLTTGYANACVGATRWLDRVPLHRFGVRAPGDALRDKAVVANGFFVIR